MKVVTYLCLFVMFIYLHDNTSNFLSMLYRTSNELIGVQCHCYENLANALIQMIHECLCVLDMKVTLAGD